MGLCVAALVGLGLLVHYSAQHKIFFTTPKEGTAEFVVVGNAVRRMIMVWKEHNANDQFEISTGKLTRNMRYYLNPLNWMEPFGIYWIGLWPFYNIYRYDFTWTEEKVDESGRTIPYTRRATKQPNTEGQTSFVRINDTNYFVIADNVKTKGGVPLKFVLLVTIRIENPYKALFMGEDWLERTAGAINNMVIRYAGVLDYEDITASSPAKLSVFMNGEVREETYSLESIIMMLGDGQPDDIQGTDLLLSYGVRIVAAKIHSIEFADSEGAQRLRDATTERYVAEQKGLGEQLQAGGEAVAIKTRADAERYRIDTTYAPIVGDDKDGRMRIRQLEAVEKSGSQGGNTIVVPDELLGFARKFTRKGEAE